MDSSEHINVCFVGNSICVYIIMSTNDEKSNAVNTNMVMTREHACMDCYDCTVYGLCIDILFPLSASLFVELCMKSYCKVNGNRQLWIFVST